MQKKIVVTIVFLFGAIFGSIIGLYLALAHDLPQIRELANFKPSAVTRIYSSDHVLLAELFVQKRDPVPLKTIPNYLKKGLLAMEDRQFYHHIGVAPRGIFRALVKDMLAGKMKEGGSTITQQLAKTLFLTPEKSLKRKIREAILAVQLERRYTKDEILELYLNQVYFGSGAYGVESAARKFFGKSVKDADLSECALLAAMPRLPSKYSPLVNLKLALKRRNIVLSQMRKLDIISEAEYEIAKSQPLRTVSRPSSKKKAPFFTDFVISSLEENLEDEFGKDGLYKRGLNIQTTLSYRLQKIAEEAIEKGIGELTGRRKKQDPSADLPQAALVAIDVRTGGILALSGGRDYSESAFNRAVTSKRQPGSAFKPVLYAYALEKGFSQNHLVLDAPVVFKGADHDKDWVPKNYHETYHGEISLRKALAISANIPAVRLMETMGPENVAGFAKTLGISIPFKPDLSMALGTMEITLLELTGAYAAFPNQGRWTEPHGVVGVTDSKGREIKIQPPGKKVAMTRTNAAIIVDMLKAVISEGTGRKAQSIHADIAGKTGTTNKFNDALFVGFSPSIAVGVWVGMDDHSSLGVNETGSRAALPIWMYFMEKAAGERPYERFDIPEDTVFVRIDPDTGNPEPDASKPGVMALFAKGKEPGSTR